MADVKISGLPASTTPLAGTEVLPIVQGTTTKQVSVANLTAGRVVSASGLGVGTTTPATYGDVAVVGNGVTSTVFVGTSSNAAPFAAGILKFGSTSNANAYINYGGQIASYSIGGVDQYDLRFYTANGAPSVERMRVFYSGGVSIGNTTDPGATNLSVTGSVIPNAAPSSKWGIDFAPSTSAGSYVSIANNATYTLASGSGLFYIYENGGNGAGSFYSFYGTPVIAWQSGASFSVNTPGQAGTINIYYSAGNFIIENKFGSTLNFFISTIRLRTSP